jgi:hypothetical protein
MAALREAGEWGWREAARERGLRQAARFTWEETARQTIESYRRAASE